MKFNFINIHAHHQQSDTNVLNVLNVSSDFRQLPESGYFSAGLHPWFIDSSTVQQEFTALERAASTHQVIAIGECGLDKACTTDFNLQLAYFKKQIELAKTIRKPLIIHCVRAYDEVLATLDAIKFDLPVIFHGFNKSSQLADQLLKAGYYISMGKHLLNNESTAALRAVPFDRLFLETDNSEIPIDSIYRAAAEANQVSEEFLTAQITANFQRVFRVPIFTTHE